jgi:GDP-L-fucose synthase
MRPVLVTGGSGLTGRAMQALVPTDRPFAFWSSGDCDLTDAAATMAAVARLHPEAIIQLAAVGGGVALSGRHPATLLRDNLRINLNVLEAARAVGAKVVLGLSSGMYPPTAPLPLREESVHQGDAHPSNYAYAFAKRMLEPMVRAYRSEHGLAVVGLSPNSIIGEHDHFHDEEASMTAALIRRCVEARDRGGPVVVWGDGTPRRELSYARDIARDFLWALERYDEPGILNVGTSEELSVREVAYAIGECLGLDRARFVFDPSKPSGVARKPTDTSRYLALSGATYTPIREALRRAVDWYVRNRGTCRRESKARPSP